MIKMGVTFKAEDIMSNDGKADRNNVLLEGKSND